MTSRVEPSALRVWPEGIMLPDLEVEFPEFEVAQTDDGTDYLVQRKPTDTWSSTRLPVEFYAHELKDLDLSSTAEIASFASRFGILELSSLVDDEVGVFEQRLAVVESQGAEYRPPAVGDLIRPPAQLKDEGAVIRARIATLRGRGEFEAWASLDEFRLAAQLLRDMTRIMQADSGALPFSTVLSEWESPLTFMKPANQETATRMLGTWISSGLAPVHPTVRHLSQWGAGKPPVDVGAFTAVCAQLFNKIASGTGFKTCSNQTCGRLFSQQRTRGGRQRPARWSAEATGLKYCSYECAQAEASRTRRSKMKTATSLADDGRTIVEIAAMMKATPEQVAGWLAAGAKTRRRGESR